MTCTSTNDRTWVRGTTEYLRIEVTADVDLTDDLPVAITLDRTTFLTAFWIGSVAHTRTCEVLLDDTGLPPDSNVTEIYVRVTDNPEIPLIPAGTLTIL